MRWPDGLVYDDGDKRERERDALVNNVMSTRGPLVRVSASCRQRLPLCLYGNSRVRRALSGNQVNGSVDSEYGRDLLLSAIRRSNWSSGVQKMASSLSL